MIRIGEYDWVRIRYVDNDKAGRPAWDRYYLPWNKDRLLSLELRFGREVSGDEAEVARLRALSESVLASLNIR